jgi:hypothetical protein
MFPGSKEKYREKEKNTQNVLFCPKKEKKKEKRKKKVFL